MAGPRREGSPMMITFWGVLTVVSVGLKLGALVVCIWAGFHDDEEDERFEGDKLGYRS